MYIYLVIWPALIWSWTWRNVALFQEKFNTSDLVSVVSPTLPIPYSCSTSGRLVVGCLRAKGSSQLVLGNQQAQRRPGPSCLQQPAAEWCRPCRQSGVSDCPSAGVPGPGPMNISCQHHTARSLLSFSNPNPEEPAGLIAYSLHAHKICCRRPLLRFRETCCCGRVTLYVVPFALESFRLPSFANHAGRRALIAFAASFPSSTIHSQGSRCRKLGTRRLNRRNTPSVRPVEHARSEKKIAPVNSNEKKRTKQTSADAQRHESFAPRSSGLMMHYASRLSYGSFSYGMHPQPYLIGAHREKYPLINHSLVSTIMS